MTRDTGKTPKADPHPCTEILTPDYAGWAKYDAWKLTTACCLVCGISPKYRYRPVNTNHFPWFIVKDSNFDYPELRRLWSLANSAIRAGKLYTSEGDRDREEWNYKTGHMCVSPEKPNVTVEDVKITFERDDPYVRSDEFIEWARGKGFDIPPELCTALPGNRKADPKEQTAAAREAAKARAAQCRDKERKKWKVLRAKKSPPSRTECARKVTGKQEPRALIDALKKAGEW